MGKGACVGGGSVCASCLSHHNAVRLPVSGQGFSSIVALLPIDLAAAATRAIATNCGTSSYSTSESSRRFLLIYSAIFVAYFVASLVFKKLC